MCKNYIICYLVYILYYMLFGIFYYAVTHDNQYVFLSTCYICMILPLTTLCIEKKLLKQTRFIIIYNVVVFFTNLYNGWWKRQTFIHINNQALHQLKLDTFIYTAAFDKNIYYCIRRRKEPSGTSCKTKVICYSLQALKKHWG